MIITNIKKASMNKYEVIIDNKKHIIFDDVLLNLNILTKKQITKEEYENIVSLNKFYEGYNEAVKYISYKQRTEKEVYNKLKLNNFNLKDIDKIISKLKQENYLNEEIYLKSFINDQMKLTLNGPSKIIELLIKKGFNKEKIDKFIDAINEDIWIIRIKKIIDKKIKSNHEYSQKKLKLKIKQDLYILGYKDNYDNLINEIEFDESSIYQKQYQKYLNRYCKNYQDEKLKMVVQKKMIELGFLIDNYN